MPLPERSQFLAPLIQACRDDDMDAIVSYFSFFTVPDTYNSVLFADLMQVLYDEPRAVLNRADRALAALGEVAVRFLSEMLNDGDRDVRSAAVRALSAIGLPKAGAGLIIALGDKDAHIVSDILHKLAYSNYESNGINLTSMQHDLVNLLVTALVGFLSNGFVNVNQSIVTSDYQINNHGRICLILRHLGVLARKAEPSLIELLQKQATHWSVRVDAASALSTVGSSAAVLALIDVIGELPRYTDDKADVSLREMATAAISSIRKSGNLLPDPANRVPEEHVWDVKASPLMRHLMVFYLVGCAYKAGHRSLRAANRYLENIMIIHGSSEYDLAVTNVSFDSNIVDLTPLFCGILDKDRVTLLIKTKSGHQHLPAQFSDDAWRAWEWTEGFLRRHVNPDWFGFALTHENNPESAS